MSDEGVLQPVGKTRVKPKTTAGLYHPSKSELIDWVNQMLLLGITRLEEFASGAVFCQMMDAHYADIVPIHRVNFHAKEEYEFIQNYKILQSIFMQLSVNREMDVQKLMRGSPSECLELLQFMHKFLRKHRIIVNYDPCERRLRSVRGGTDRIPMPYWMHSHFDVYGRPEGIRRDIEHSYDGYIEAGRRSRTSRTPDPSGSFALRSSKQRPHIRTASADARNYATELTAAMREMQRNRRTMQDSTEFSISQGRSRTPVAARSSKSPAPVDNPAMRKLPGPRGTPPPSPARKNKHRSTLTSTSRRTQSDAESSAHSIYLKAVESIPHTEPTRQETVPQWSAPEEVAEEGLLAVRRCLDALSEAVPNFSQLLEDLGTENDNYAYRGKLRSMKDVVITLLRHNGLLIDNLEAIRNQNPEEWHHAFRGFSECVDHIHRLESEFQECVHKLTEMETRNPIPRSCALSMTEEQKRLSDMRSIDSVLRKIGAAQASMDLTVLHENYPQQDRGTSSPDGSQPTRAEEVLVKNLEQPSSALQGDYQIRRLRNGDIYKGHYRGTKKDGLGVYQFINGDIYEGEFVVDRLSGNGVYTFVNEGRYEGEWKNSVYEGSGNETFARGSTYHGDYVCGMRDGWGACRYYNGDYYEGQWRHGLREGRGMQQCTEESNYIGDYVAGKRHGYGLYCFPNSDRYIGEYECDIPHGYGVYIFSTEQKYEGQWEQGKKHGWCIYTIETGEMWAGEWVEGKPKWVQGLSNKEELDPRWPPEIVEKVEKAWMACRRARDSAQEGETRAKEHWNADGEIQRSIKEAKARAESVAQQSQDARKEAIQIAATLDALAAEKQSG